MGKINSEPQVKMVGQFKVVSFFLSVRDAGKYDKEAGQYGYASFLVEAWGKNATFIESYCPKGTVIAVAGSLKQDSWQAPEGTKERVKISADRFSFVPAAPENFINSEDLEENNSQFAIDPFDP